MRRVIVGLAVLAVLAVAYWWWQGQDESGPDAARPATTVNVAPAVTRPITETLEAVGTARASRAVELSAEVEGRVRDIRFQEGENVDAGTELVILDDRQARAELGRTQAEYQQALADSQRASRLVDSRSISQSEAENLKAVMEAAKADLDASRANMDDHVIRAPFSGMVGLRRVDEGAYLSVGDPVTTLDATRELEVNFQVPERYLARLTPELKVAITSDAYPGRTFQGRVALWDTRIDAASRSLTVKAVMNNQEGLLRPGQFLQVSVLWLEQPALLVPEQAIISQGAQSYVFTIDDENRAERRPVSLGGRRDGWVEITAGLDPDQEVIVNGHSRLGSGAPVKVVDDEDGALLPAQRELLKESA